MTERLEAETVIDGRYRVLSRLGSGGMADVYCAEDLQLGRKVALKVLHHRFAEDQEFVERFRREASSAAGLQHPNVVGVFDRGEWDGTYYIAMEYLAGRSLKTIVREEAPLDPTRAIDIDDADPARRALRPPPRVIHRDLKPHNVIVDEEGRAQGHRLRHRARRRVGHDADRLDHGHRAVPVARAGPGPRGQRGLGPLLGRGDAVRAAHRRACPFEGETAVAIALKQVPSAPRAAERAQPGGLARRSTRSCCGRWRRTRRSATPTPTSSSPRCRPRATARPTAVLAPVPPPPLDLPARPTPTRRSRWRRASRREGGRWWLWLLAVLVAAPGPRRRAPAARHAEGHRAHVVGADQANAEAKLRQDGFHTDSALKTADAAQGPGHRPGPDGRVQGQEGLDGDPHRLRRAPAGRRCRRSSA